METKTKIILTLLGLLVLCGGALAYVFNRYQKAQIASENNAALAEQNKQAYAQQLSQRDSSIQDLAVKVTNLNDSVFTQKKKANKYYALSTTLQLKIDSVSSFGAGISSTGEDSLGKYSQVDFQTQKGIAHISGYTRYYASTLSSWSVDAEFDSPVIRSSLYQEKSSGLWKILTESQTPGITLKQFSDIDSSLYISLRSSEVSKQKESNTFPSFGMRLKGNVATTKSDIEQKNVKGLGFDLSAEVYYKYYNITYYPLTGVLSGGVVVNFDVGRFLNLVF